MLKCEIVFEHYNCFALFLLLICCCTIIELVCYIMFRCWERCFLELFSTCGMDSDEFNKFITLVDILQPHN